MTQAAIAACLGIVVGLMFGIPIGMLITSMFIAADKDDA